MTCRYRCQNPHKIPNPDDADVGTFPPCAGIPDDVAAVYVRNGPMTVTAMTLTKIKDSARFNFCIMHGRDFKKVGTSGWNDDVVCIS